MKGATCHVCCLTGALYPVPLDDEHCATSWCRPSPVAAADLPLHLLLGQRLVPVACVPGALLVVAAAADLVVSAEGPPLLLVAP